jgi:hypothetical protein
MPQAMEKIGKTREREREREEKTVDRERKK